MDLKSLKGVGDKTLVKLNSLGIYSVADLVNYMPKSYLDMTKISTPEQMVEGEYSLLKVTIIKVYPKQYSKNKLCYIKCDSLSGELPITLIWFNMPYMEYNLKCGEFLVWGIVRFENNKYSLINPNIASVDNKYKLKDVKPIYSLKGKVGEVTYRKILDNALENYTFDNLLPELFNMSELYKNIHFPKRIEDMENSQLKLAIYELVIQLLCYKSLRANVKCTPINFAYPQYVDYLLDYKLTDSQVQAIEDVIFDLYSGNLMNRFVLGDVGSGKTIVAHIIISMFCEKNLQNVLLAPTEILALQHYKNFEEVFGKLGFESALLTSSTSKAERDSIIEKVKNGQIKVVFSTHSCLNGDIEFKNLKFAVIDEVHKFGVKNKANLLSKGSEVHCLSMSATPLPRSFAMVTFGDMKISKLYKAENRKTNIKTFILRSNKLDNMFSYFADKIKNGSQIIIVCPRIVDSELEDFYSVKSVYNLISKRIFNKEDIGLLYGNMKSEAKDKVINDFYNGKIKILVSTTVIEVGIDIPAVDTIAILGADRFGIASLHQLRGRVGRDGRPAECYLHCTSYTVPNRIRQMKEIDDGVLLSEIDAEERGYGDLLGFNQSGKNNFNKFVVKINKDSINLAKEIVNNIDINKLDKDLLNKYLEKYEYYQDIVLN